MNVAEKRRLIVEALSDVLTVCPNANVTPTEYPAGIVQITGMTPDTHGAESWLLTAQVTVLVSRSDAEQCWERVDELMSCDDLYDALEPVADVTSISDVGEIAYDEGVFVGFVVNLEVL